MNLERAKRIVRPILQLEFKDNYELIDIWDETCFKFERGWLINYMSKEFIQDPINGLGLIGHKPFILDILDMKVYELSFNINPILSYDELIEIYLFEKQNNSQAEILPFICNMIESELD